MGSKLAGIHFKIVDRDNGKTSKRELHMICILVMMEQEAHDGTLRYVLMGHWEHCLFCVYYMALCATVLMGCYLGL